MYKFKVIDLRPNLQGFVTKSAVIKVFPDDPCRRCGYMWLSTDWVFGLFGKKDPMREACRLHDDLFADPAGLTRKEVDDMFYRAMTVLIKEKGDKWYLYIQRDVYYGIVRSVGWLWW
jgi:hypothetical protein